LAAPRGVLSLLSVKDKISLKKLEKIKEKLLKIRKWETDCSSEKQPTEKQKNYLKHNHQAFCFSRQVFLQVNNEISEQKKNAFLGH